MPVTFADKAASRPRTRARFAIPALVTVAFTTLGLTGCSGDDMEVATLRGQGDPSGTETGQLADARAMVNCLEEAGIPAELVDYGNGQGEVMPSTEQAYQMTFSDQGWGTYAAAAVSDGDFDAQMARWELMSEQYQDAEGFASQPMLFIGEKDHSVAFAKCVDETGYAPGEFEMDPAEELKQKQATAKASAEWAKCARENGYPGMADPPPPKADNWESRASVVLPATITVEELKALLEVCPNFDREAWEEYDNATADGMWSEDWPDPPVEPDIEIEMPDNLEWDEATTRHYDELWEVMWAQSSAYWDENATVAGITVVETAP